LYNKEKEVINNRNQIEPIIDKILFQLDGEMKLKYLLGEK